jgi:chromatin segregation and condensation protein Rec8/ScpA/Scc1 (kleisin family)
MLEKNQEKASEKPFWLRPPLAVLFDLIKLQRIKPWSVNLSYLLTTLTSEIMKKGHIDFNASGMALLSSATIYRMKSELILELQEPPQIPADPPTEFVPPSIQLPFRYEFTTTTVDNLVQALEQALQKEDFIEPPPRLIPIVPAPPLIQEIDEFLIDIDSKIDEMYQQLAHIKTKIVELSELTTGAKKMEIIRIFLLLLFLACRGKILLWQDEDCGEIFVSLKRTLNGSQS